MAIGKGSVFFVFFKKLFVILEYMNMWFLVELIHHTCMAMHGQDRNLDRIISLMLLLPIGDWYTWYL